MPKLNKPKPSISRPDLSEALSYLKGFDWVDSDEESERFSKVVHGFIHDFLVPVVVKVVQSELESKK